MKPPVIRDMERAMKAEYSKVEEGKTTDKILNGMQKFCEAAKKKATLAEVLNEAGMTIFRLFPFKEIGIGLRKRDGNYGYAFLIGHSPAAQEAHKSITLTYDDMMSEGDYEYIQLSKYTQFNFAEGIQTDALKKHEQMYNRPSMLAGARQSIDTLVEGDYFDIYMFGKDDEMLGWIEVSNTKDMKMPPMRAIKWIELFAMILAPIVEKEL